MFLPCTTFTVDTGHDISSHQLMNELHIVSSGIDKSTEWATTSACPSRMYFLTGAIPKGLIFENVVFDVCVGYVCFASYKFVAGLIL